MAELQQDIWSRWLRNRRFGGDPERLMHVLDYLYPVRDKVLSHISLEEGGTLLDVGCKIRWVENNPIQTGLRSHRKNHCQEV